MKILFSNLGYARGIDGTLAKHVAYAGRHFYCAPVLQQQSLAQFQSIIREEEPDLCCIVEIDRGSFHSGYFNQLQFLMDRDYRFHDIADKYGDSSLLGRIPFHVGKSNAFLARHAYSFQRLYFKHGTKRLIYQIELPQGLVLFFAHFSLQRKTREKQFMEMRHLAEQYEGRAIIMADFNILHGMGELDTLLQGTDLCVMNRGNEPTFNFARRNLTLDLCICSEDIAKQTSLQVIKQSFSDHAALLLRM